MKKTTRKNSKLKRFIANKNSLKLSDIESLIIEIREQKAILDSDVAKLYGVETKHINQAVKNNLKKFPLGYIIELNTVEWSEVKSKILTSPTLGGGKVKIPNAFTEKGLYMLATILKSERATETTIAIIEAFSKFRELSRTIKQLSNIKNEDLKKGFLQKGSDIITNLLDEDVFTNESETTIELNFAVLKLKHTVKKNKRANQ